MSEIVQSEDTICKFQSIYKQSHLIKKPVSLKCKCTACYDCVVKAKNLSFNILIDKYEPIKCAKCDEKYTLNDADQFEVNSKIEMFIRDNLKQVLCSTLDEYRLTLTQFSHEDSYKTLVDTYFEFVESNIEIRFESIRNEIDEKFEQQEFKFRMQCKNILEKFQKSNQNLLDRLTNKRKHNFKCCSKLLKKQRNLCDYWKTVRNDDVKLYIEPRKDIFRPDIGTVKNMLYFSKVFLCRGVQILNSEAKYLIKMLYLGGEILIIDNIGGTLKLFDMDGNLISTILKPERNTNVPVLMYPMSICKDNHGHIIVNDLNRLLVLDKNFTYLKEVTNIDYSDQTIVDLTNEDHVYCIRKFRDLLFSVDISTKKRLNQVTINKPLNLGQLNDKLYVIHLNEKTTETFSMTIVSKKTFNVEKCVRFSTWTQSCGFYIDYYKNIFLSAFKFNSVNQLKSQYRYLLVLNEHGDLLSEIYLNDIDPLFNDLIVVDEQVIITSSILKRNELKFVVIL